MSKIVSFGDSFVYGSELPNNDHGDKAWAGLIAKSIGAEYQTLAVAGCGNDAIARQIYEYFSNNTEKNTLAVINWTWTMRWDFYITKHETWITLGPTCVPEKLQHLIDTTESQRLVNFYNDYANKSLCWNKFRNLQTIFAAQQYLKIKKINAIQTYMDYQLFDTTWHAPTYIQELQKLVKQDLLLWEGRNFVDWCAHRGHHITPTLHPVGNAHNDAADFWKNEYQLRLGKSN